jgi:Glycosyl hydrolases family 2, sugar binding domain/Glycosyl hydrolases family 2/Glycosyl hydrolases family 2, TIM barrel domain
MIALRKPAVAIILIGIFLFQETTAQTAWKIAGEKISTNWAAMVDYKHPLPEYPRPQMQRNNWVNLNGLWDYAIKPVAEKIPTVYDGKILVPYPVESALSGVAGEVGKDNCLWYRTKFIAPKIGKDKRLLLHFGAVDWQSTIYINGKELSTHKGGFDPFHIDITEHLKKGQQELQVRVWDPTDEGPQPRGKQVKNPNSIWYTPVTGIWQTVWLETVNIAHIENINPVADIDNNIIRIETGVKDAKEGDQLKVSISEGGNNISEQIVNVGSIAEVQLKEVKRWSPANPFLYDLKIQLLRNGQAVDEVSSYFAMRKISLSPDKNGVQRLMFNNEFLFQFGMLDQGWWPDGLYTAATDEALQYDIVKAKEMGFNMLRKHVKVEPARWYYHCDKIGMLVWQDMPSGDMAKGDQWITNPALEPMDKIRTAESEQIFKTELKAIMDAAKFFPSIVAWVPFNEAWGQFKTVEITKWVMNYDKSRLVNSASGGNFHLAGHMHDYHHYPPPIMQRADLFGKSQAVVLGEYGGLGLPIEGHTWQNKANWGYQSFKNADSLLIQYGNFVSLLEDFIPKGLSAAIYTQVSDVEGEVNGLMTYDRKLIKMPVDKLNKINSRVYKPLR